MKLVIVWYESIIVTGEGLNTKIRPVDQQSSSMKNVTALW